MSAQLDFYDFLIHIAYIIEIITYFKLDFKSNPSTLLLFFRSSLELKLRAIYNPLKVYRKTYRIRMIDHLQRDFC